MSSHAPKTLSVAAIRHGTVIDHIAAGRALAILQLLKLPQGDHLVTVGMNLPSKSLGRKDLIKVEGRELSGQEVNHIAILSAEASINIIRDYAVKKKFRVQLPGSLEGVIVCPNPTCITNHERVNTVFSVSSRRNRVFLACAYCEKQYTQEDIQRYRV